MRGARACDHAGMTTHETEAGLLFVGGGGHALVIAEAAQTLFEQSGLKPVGCLDDDDHPALSSGSGAVPRLGPLSELGRFAGEHLNWILAIGSPSVRRSVLNDLPGALTLGSAWTVVHPSAVVSPSAQLGRGVFVGPGAIVHARARVRDHAIINSGAIIEHQCEVGENAHVAPGSVLGGEAVVEDDAMVGLGARVLPMRRIGAGAMVGAGAVVLENVDAGATVVGVPAEPLA